MRSWRSSPVILLAIWLALPCAGITYEVAQRHPQATDAGPGSTEQPWKTFRKAAESVRTGDVVLIRSGVYRERAVVKASGTAEAPIRFEAAPGEHVVLTGADQISAWQRTDDAASIYHVGWPHRFITWNPSMTHPGDEYHRVIGRCEQVLVNGYSLRQVLNASQLAPGTFFVDITNQTLHAWDWASRDLRNAYVEASVRQDILRIEGDFIHLRGLHFRYAANMAQRGAVILAGDQAVMEDCVIEGMNSSGATFAGEDSVVRRSTFRENGQLGFGASQAHRLLFTECLVENNNTKGFDRGWEAGGNKLALCRDAVLERSRFLRNRGNGIWFDIGNTNCIVRECLIAENDDAGIFYEISYRLLAHDNVIIGNGFAQTAGAWGAQSGISLSSSPGCVIERNLILANREGFNFREQLRTTRTIEDRTERPIWNHDELIQNNVIAYNRDAQVWGWFDVKDGRHWPSRQATSSNLPSASTTKPENLAEPYTAKRTDDQPQGLTLAALQLRFKDNIFQAAVGQGWFKWGPTWARHKVYAALPEFQSELGVDSGSQSLEPGFADIRRLDLRLPSERMSRLKAAYPRGSIPGVVLGIQ